MPGESFNKFQQFKHSLIADLEQIDSDAADLQVDMQTRLCPKSDEQHVHLVETIHKRVEGDKVYVEEGDEQHEYWIHLEYGTQNMSATPHIRPAHAAAVRYRDARQAALRLKYS